MKRPWLKFYPADWRADPRLRMCSLAARGLWIDLISYMHEGHPYGHLTIDGTIPTLDDIASLVARPISEVRRALAELETKQVFSRSDVGAIYSRRMVKDHERAVRDSANGKIGGNPDITPKRSEGVNPQVKAQKLEARAQKDDDGDDTRTSDGCAITAEAFALCDDLLRLQRLEKDDPRCIATAYAVQAWLTKGWRANTIRSTVDIVMSKRAEAPNALRYFEKAIAAAHAEHDRPLPIAIIQEELPHVVRKNGHPATISPLIAAADALVARAHERLAEVRGEGGFCDGESPPTAWAVPAGGGK